MEKREALRRLQSQSDGYEPSETVVPWLNQEGLDSPVEEWNATEIKLMKHELSALPENPNCPSLVGLHLEWNTNLTEIPLKFFDSMPLLQVLDLSYTSIKSLPPSISRLVELRELLLRGCELLMELPPEIGALRNLKVLDLEGAELIFLPKKIGYLLKLECLKVSLNRGADQYKVSKGIRRIIPRATLSKLTVLKELSIHLDPDCGWWEVEVEATINQLSKLRNLETLKLYIPTVKLLKHFLQRRWDRKLEWRMSMPLIYLTLLNFRLTVGCHEQRIMPCLPRDLQDKFEALEKCLKYVNGDGNMDGIGNALKHAQALFLDRHWTIERLSVFKADEMDQMRFCLLVECSEMKTVVDGGDFYQQIHKYNGGKLILGSLQYLSLHYMKNLESIWRGRYVGDCLSSLQVLALHTCPELTTIFNLPLLRNLVKLKELIIEDCPKLQTIVSGESSEDSAHDEFLPSLEKISLLHLPRLLSISSGLSIAPKLERMVIYNCPMLTNLSSLQTFENMKEIKGESEWLEAISNRPDYFDDIFVPLRRDGDLMDQLAEARNSLNPLCMIENSSETEGIFR